MQPAPPKCARLCAKHCRAQWGMRKEASFSATSRTQRSRTQIYVQVVLLPPRPPALSIPKIPLSDPLHRCTAQRAPRPSTFPRPHDLTSRAAREQARWQPQGSRLAGARSRHLDAVWLVLPARADVIVRLATAKHEAYPPRRSKQRAPCHPRPAHISAMLRARQQGLRPPSILRGGGWRSRVIGVDGASHR